MKKYLITPFLKYPDGSLKLMTPGPPLPVTAERVNELFEKFANVGGNDPLSLPADSFVYRIQTIDDDEVTIDDYTWKRQGVLAVK